ncbi:hypothetical protein O3G_MSEX007755 [Manduca sexta]|uniref:VMP93 n=1 Tax=Manduca sexta TaxID=7130 RepID=I0E0A4_MANSE|nr:VMP93 [Manduca sexta]KAG6452722.1 hypothetical protein O3G_MSEX007755 [Manduca sexta]
METLVVLTALVCGAIAAPALHEQGFQEFKTTQDFSEDLTLREKKSPAGNHGFTEFSNIDTSPSHAFELDSFPETARSLNFKKPIIVKKKVGYHLYRDSDEEKEQANSRESCKERVKVKLCDEKILPKSSDLMRTTTIEDIGDHVMSEDEMKHSLKMAKEAIANLERDLRKMEQKPETKLTQREHDDVDAHIHEDIDAARQVLEHIHKNFGDMETMSIHTTTAKDSDSLHNVHVTIAKTEEERMAQWKEAMKNIQKNSEIARNIEDSFKSFNDFQMTQTPNMNDNIDSHPIFHEMRAGNIELIDKTQDKPKQCDSKLLDAKEANNQGERKDSTDDMNSFASTIVESHVNANNDNLGRNNNGETNFHENPTTNTMIGSLNEDDSHIQRSKSSDIHFDGKKQFDTADSEQSKINSMRNVEQGSGKDLHINNSETMTTDGDILTPNSIVPEIHMKSTEPDKTRNAADCLDKDVVKTFNDDKTNTNKPEDMNTLTKSATNNDSLDTHENNQLQAEHGKSVDTLDTTPSNQLLHQTRSNNDDAMTGETQHVQHAIAKPFGDTEINQFQGKMGQNEQMMPKSQLTIQGQDFQPLHKELHTGMKSSDNDNTPKQPSKHAFNMRWSSDQKTNNEHKLSNGMDDFPSDVQNRAPSLNTHFMNGPHMMPSMTSSSNFDASSTHAHIHTSHMNRIHGPLTHGKSQDMDSMAQPNFHMNMRDAGVNFGPDNNMMHWKPTHESARTAYGPLAPVAGSVASPSAVGLFPNANVGGCSIPLLLSCSPSVTSGSLAKALPAGYASPAYRTEDEFSFFPNKREVKKMNEISDTTNIKTPTNTKQKIKTNSDTKQ